MHYEVASGLLCLEQECFGLICFVVFLVVIAVEHERNRERK